MILKSEALAPHTNIRLGGPAQFFAACQTIEQLTNALKLADAKHLPVFILGGGTNTIFADYGFTGLVIKVDLPGIEFNGDHVTVASGENWDDLVVQTLDKNLAGLECLSGIPGQVGATPIQNVGAYGQQVSDTITTVQALDRQSLKLVKFTNADCQFSYRTSRFKQADVNHYIITQVTFQLVPGGPPTVVYPELQASLGDTPTLLATRQAVLKLRRRKSMIIDAADPHSRSCGSFFINPILTPAELQALTGLTSNDLPYFPVDNNNFKVPAAYLVEQAGFTKGQRQGGVGISPNHALALVNYDGTTTQLLTLADQIKSTVLAKFNIELQPEPIIAK